MKKKIVLYVLLTIVAIISGSLFIDYNKVQNVFDEMYYTWDGYFKFFIHTKFKNVPAFENQRLKGYIYPGDNVETNILRLYYDETYLENNGEVSLNIYPDEKYITFYCSIVYERQVEDMIAEEEIFMIFSYDVKTKVLLLKPINIISNSIAKQYPDKYDCYTYYDDPEYIEMFMAEHDITKEEIEAYRDYFLRDVLIGMWVDGNDEESRYDRSDAGHFVLKDELFANFE